MEGTYESTVLMLHPPIDKELAIVRRCDEKVKIVLLCITGTFGFWKPLQNFDTLFGTHLLVIFNLDHFLSIL